MKVHLEQLYKYSYGVTFYDTELFMAPRSTDKLAAMVIVEKQAYRKRIAALQAQNRRFELICEQLSVNDKDAFTSFFQNCEKVGYQSLRESILSNLDLLERIYEEDNERKRQQYIRSHQLNS